MAERDSKIRSKERDIETIIRGLEETANNSIS